MNRIFREEHRTREWLTRGFFRMPLLSREEVESLGDALLAPRPQGEPCASGGREVGAGIRSSFDDPDLDYRRRIFEMVRDAFAPHLDKVLDGYRIALGGLYLKAPGSAEVRLHSDFTFTADPHAVALNVWCPLVDVSDANGGLRLVPGSHRLLDHIGAPGNLPYFHGYEQALKERSTPVDLRAGEAVIFDSALLHWSPPNESGSARPVVACTCLPEAAVPAVYRRDEEGRRFEKFDLSDGGFFAQSARELFEGTVRARSLGFVENRNRSPSLREFERLRAKGPKLRKRLLGHERGGAAGRRSWLKLPWRPLP